MPPICGRRRLRRPGGGENRRGAWFLPGAVVLIAVTLSGCAAPVGVLEPSPAPAADATHLDVLVATTRAASLDKGVLFSGERGEASLASFVVSIPSDDRREIGQVQWPRTLPPDPNTEFATLRIERLSALHQFESWLEGVMHFGA